MKDKGKRMERGIRRWIDGINVVRGWEWIWKWWDWWIVCKGVVKDVWKWIRGIR